MGCQGGNRRLTLLLCWALCGDSYFLLGPRYSGIITPGFPMRKEPESCRVMSADPLVGHGTQEVPNNHESELEATCLGLFGQ